MSKFTILFAILLIFAIQNVGVASTNQVATHFFAYHYLNLTTYSKNLASQTVITIPSITLDSVQYIDRITFYCGFGGFPSNGNYNIRILYYNDQNLFSSWSLVSQYQIYNIPANSCTDVGKPITVNLDPIYYSDFGTVFGLVHGFPALGIAFSTTSTNGAAIVFANKSEYLQYYNLGYYQTVPGNASIWIDPQYSTYPPGIAYVNGSSIYDISSNNSVDWMPIVLLGAQKIPALPTPVQTCNPATDICGNPTPIPTYDNNGTATALPTPTSGYYPNFTNVTVTVTGTATVTGTGSGVPAAIGKKLGYCKSSGCTVQDLLSMLYDITIPMVWLSFIVIPVKLYYVRKDKRRGKKGDWF